MSSFIPRIDHVVITVADRLDEAERRYRRIGFALTERGHHTLGTSNHLAIFGQDYLELLGYEPGRGTPRPTLWLQPPGLSGLAFKPLPEEGFFDALRARGLPVDPTQSFSRPVMTDEGERVARFRTANYAHPAIGSGRVFFCHHETPEVVWRDQWRGHGNGVRGIAEFIISASDPAASATAYTELFGAQALRVVEGGVALRTDTADIQLLTPHAVTARLGSAAPSLPMDGDRMAALGLFTADPSAVARRLHDEGFAGLVEQDGAVLMPADEAAGVALIFRR